MAKLKKSNQRGRSQRSIELEEKRNAAIAAHEEEIRKKETRRNNAMKTIFCWYSLVASAFSVVLGFWGIFSIMAIGFGIYGIKMLEGKRNRDFYAAAAGIVIGAIWLVVQIVVALQRMG